MKVVQPIIRAAVLTALSLFTSLSVFSQEGGGTAINVDINKEGGSAGWYTSPWVWIAGAAIFIILLVALLRGDSRRE